MTASAEIRGAGSPRKALRGVGAWHWARALGQLDREANPHGGKREQDAPTASCSPPDVAQRTRAAWRKLGEVGDEVKVRAERALGQLDAEANPHGRPGKGSDAGTFSLDLRRETRAAWRKLAEVLGIAERDENTEREPFKPSEAVAMGKKLEELERPKAAERKGGRPPKHKTSEKFTEVSEKGETREKVGAAIGMSGPTYSRARARAKGIDPDSEKFPESKATGGEAAAAGSWRRGWPCWRRRRLALRDKARPGPSAN